MLNEAVTAAVLADASTAWALFLVVDVSVVAFVALGANVGHRCVENECALRSLKVDGLLLLHARLNVHCGAAATLHHVALGLLLLGVAHLLLGIAHLRLLHLLLGVAHWLLLHTRLHHWLLLGVAHWLLLLRVSHLLLLLGVAHRLLLHTRLHHGLLLRVSHLRLLLGISHRLLLHTRLHHRLLLLHHGLLLLHHRLLHHWLLLLHYRSLHVVISWNNFDSLCLMLGDLTICVDNLGWGQSFVGVSLHQLLTVRGPF